VENPGVSGESPLGKLASLNSPMSGISGPRLFFPMAGEHGLGIVSCHLVGRQILNSYIYTRAL
jgi:hypothetical protein